MNFDSLIDTVSKIDSKPADAQFLLASDGIKIAYRTYSASSPKAVLVFYHGGAAHSAASYHVIGNQLVYHGISTVMPDIRGHGESDGSRGDAPSSAQVWMDIKSMLGHVESTFPSLPIFIGGHSSGSGLILNYVARYGTENLKGIIFLAPQLGFRSKTTRTNLQNFAKVNIPFFAFHAMSFGLLFGHSVAVQFQLPDRVTKDPKAVTGNTVYMANALTPSAPSTQLKSIKIPIGFWIGVDDEVIDSNKLKTFMESNTGQKFPNCEVKVNHLNIILNASELFKGFILELVK